MHGHGSPTETDADRNNAADADRSGALRHAPRLLLTVALFLVGINLRPAISSLSPVLLSVIEGTGMSSAAAGMLTTLPVLCFGMFAVFAPRLARRHSSERVILYGLLALAAGIGLRSYVGIPGLFVGTAVAGASISIIMVLVPGIIKRDFPDRAGPLTGLYTMALCLGAAVAAGATVPIQNLADGDWRPALAFWMVPALGAALVWWPQLQRHTHHAGKAPDAVQGLRYNALAWQVSIHIGTQSALAYCVFGWLPTILIDRGMPPVSAGLVLSVSVAMQAVTALGGPWLAARGRDQRVAISVMLGMTLAGLLGCIYAPLDTIWSWAILLGLGQGGSFSVSLMLIVLRSPNAQVAALLSAMAQGFGYSIAALGPFLVGVLYDYSQHWDSVAIFLAAVTMISLIAGLGAGRTRFIEIRTTRSGQT